MRCNFDVIPCSTLFIALKTRSIKTITLWMCVWDAIQANTRTDHASMCTSSNTLNLIQQQQQRKNGERIKPARTKTTSVLLKLADI